MKRALITGIRGQDGYYLSNLLRSKGYEVYGLVRPGEPENEFHLSGDIGDPTSLEPILRRSRPEEIYNLAGQSSVAKSYRSEQETTRINGYGPAHLIEAARRSGLALEKMRLCQASSSQIFAPSSKAQTEKSKLDPQSPYGRSKLIAHEYVVGLRVQGHFACNAILFNHESPRRSEEFVSQKIATGVVRIARGEAQELVLGNLRVKRDWGFAGDYVEAMWLMLQADTPTDYIVATGELHTLEEFLDLAFAEVGISEWRHYVRTDPQFVRPNDAETLYGDPTRTRERLGWKPRVGFPELVRVMVETAGERVDRSG